jgi:hypothetical protein
VCALYGLKSASAAFCAHLALFMRLMGYTSCKADPNLWYEAETRPADNLRYYAYILLLCQQHFMRPPQPYVGTQFDPDIYLSTKLKMTQLDNGICAWGLSPYKYVTKAVKNCAKHLTNKLNNCFCLPQQADNPFPYDYRPELDLSKPLDPECSSFYQHLISVMRWMVELGPIDVATEVSLLSSHLAYPQEGHLETALHIMSYLSQKHVTRLIFDPTYPKIDMGQFQQYNWTKFYGNVEEAIPVDMPKPLGKDLDT